MYRWKSEKERVIPIARDSRRCSIRTLCPRNSVYPSLSLSFSFYSLSFFPLFLILRFLLFIEKERERRGGDIYTARSRETRRDTRREFSACPGERADKPVSARTFLRGNNNYCSLYTHERDRGHIAPTNRPHLLVHYTSSTNSYWGLYNLSCSLLSFSLFLFTLYTFFLFFIYLFIFYSFIIFIDFYSLIFFFSLLIT